MASEEGYLALEVSIDRISCCCCLIWHNSCVVGRFELGVQSERRERIKFKSGSRNYKRL